MALIQLRNITKSFPDNDLFTDLSIQIDKQDRIGLIGDNGTGKSTLMEIIAGEEYFEQGEIVKINNYNFGHLTQEFKLDESCGLFEAMLKVYNDLARLETRLNELEEEMAKQEGADLAEIMDEYGQVRERYEQEGGYEYESKIKKILFGLGFNEADLDKKLVDLSGGEKTRASLAKLLIEEPDLLLLDEPGNHLDLAAKEWLEEYLQGYDGAFMLISHDRYLLDKLVNKIWELERGRFEEYNCSYQNYLKEKKLRLKNWKREYEKQQKEIKRLEKYIRKNKAGVDSKQARGRQKKLERMKKIPKPPKIRKAEFEFNLKTESGHDVLNVEALTKSYDDTLFSDFNLRVYKGDKIGVVGPNGSGKSTFLKLILGEKEADRGEINFGSNINLGYYDQEHSNLTPENNLIEELKKVSDAKEEKIRNFLGSFLFTGSEVLEKISTLSGGEKARVALAKLAIQDLNLLIMDEPTNHLDIKSREVLEKALKKYFGTMIVISHDRYFLNQIVDRIIAFKAGEIKKYKGNYSYYRRQYKKELSAQKREEKRERKEKEAKVKTNKSSKAEKNKINLEDLEEKIMELEDELSQIEKQLEDKEVIANQEKLRELTKRYETIQEKLADYYNDWEKII